MAGSRSVRRASLSEEINKPKHRHKRPTPPHLREDHSAIAARFDLELIQYDVVNAFVHASIDQEIFMRMPPGHRKKGTILMLNKALYGLRISPLLWQKEFMKTLTEIGYTQVPHEPCCFIKEGVLIFFYVDDVIVAYRKKDDEELKHLPGNSRRNTRSVEEIPSRVLGHGSPTRQNQKENLAYSDLLP
jgi:hypothetical protein